MSIQLLILKSSHSGKKIAAATGIHYTHWQGNAPPLPDVPILNWGVQGLPMRKFLQKYPHAESLLKYNAIIPGNKWNQIQLIKNTDVPVPISDSNVDQAAYSNTHWIYKPFYSGGGNGIFRINDETIAQCNWGCGYAQQEVLNRRYEVRVSAFNWLPKEQWGYWKKVYNGENADQLCWNHEQGGTFCNVSGPLRYPLFQRLAEYAEIILPTLDLDFGAIDFIITEDWTAYFLECNTRPGFTNYSSAVYINAVNALNGTLEEEEVEEEDRLAVNIERAPIPMSQEDYADYWAGRSGGAILCPLCGEIGCVSDRGIGDLLYCPNCDKTFNLITKVIGYEEV